MECKKGKGEDLLVLLQIWQKSRMEAKRFGEYFRIFKVLKLETSPGQTELRICMNAVGRRYQISVEMVCLVGLMDPNRVVEVTASPNSRTKNAKVPINELFLCQLTTDKKPTFLLVKK